MKNIFFLLIISLLFLNSCKDDEKQINRTLDTHADWMTSLIDEKGEQVALRNISMPSAHDAGMYVLSSCTLGANACNTQTQDKDMTTMLEAGVRMYDIRPVLSGDGYYTEHATECGGLGCKGDAIANILQQTKDFLDRHSELVVFTFGHWCNTNEDDQDLIDMVESIMGDRLYVSNGNETTGFIDKPLGDVVDIYDGKGKLIILYSGADATSENQAKGVFSYDYMPTEGSYANSFDLEEMSNNQLQKFNDYDPSSNRIFEMSWTMTLDTNLSILCAFSDDSSIKYYADGANAQLDASMEDWMNNGTITKGKIPNVINVDFADKFVTDVCIKMNNMNLN